MSHEHGENKNYIMKINHSKHILATWAICMLATSLFAQGSYVNANIGYGFKAGSASAYNYTSPNGSNTTEHVAFSFGKGLTMAAAFGYMFNKNVGAELGLSYLLGGKTKVIDSYSSGSDESSFSAKILRINPSMIISSGMESINPYAKFGLIIGKGSIKSEYTEKNNGDVYITKVKYNGGVAFGFSSAIGLMFKLSESVALLTEVNMINLSYAPTKGEVTEATLNGADQLPSMTTSQKKIEFVDSHVSTSNSTSSVPSEQVKSKYPFGSVGINFGLRINL